MFGVFPHIHTMIVLLATIFEFRFNASAFLTQVFQDR